MPARIDGVSASRVVDRPRAVAAVTSASLAVAISANTVVVGEQVGEAGEELGELIVGGARQLCERVDGGRHRAVDHLVLGPRHVQQIARLVHHHQPVAGSEAGRQLVGHDRHPVATERHHLTGEQPVERRTRARCGAVLVEHGT